MTCTAAGYKWTGPRDHRFRLWLLLGPYRGFVLSPRLSAELVARNPLVITASEVKRPRVRAQGRYMAVPPDRPGLAPGDYIVLLRKGEVAEVLDRVITANGVVDSEGYRRYYGLEAWPGVPLPPGAWACISDRGKREVIELAAANLQAWLERARRSLTAQRHRGPVVAPLGLLVKGRPIE